MAGLGVDSWDVVDKAYPGLDVENIGNILLKLGHDIKSNPKPTRTEG